MVFSYHFQSSFHLKSKQKLSLTSILPLSSFLSWSCESDSSDLDCLSSFYIFTLNIFLTNLIVYVRMFPLKWLLLPSKLTSMPLSQWINSFSLALFPLLSANHFELEDGTWHLLKLRALVLKLWQASRKVSGSTNGWNSQRFILNSLCLDFLQCKRDITKVHVF